MIYLIATSQLVRDKKNSSNNLSSEVILKIGYSDDERGEGRFRDYRSNGLDIEVLYYVSGGSYQLESIIQNYFSKFSIPGRSKEWFYYRNEIIDFFKNYQTSQEMFRFLIDNFMIAEDGKSNFFLLPGIDDQIDLIAEGYLSDHGKDDVYDFLINFRRLSNFQDRMKFLCEEVISKSLSDIVLPLIPGIYSLPYYNLGPKKIKALEYRKKELNLEYEKLFTRQQMEDNITAIIYDQFEVGKRYRRSDIKRILGDIFERFGVKNIVPKANMIEDYFDIKSVQINDPITKKRDKGFELIRKK